MKKSISILFLILSVSWKTETTKPSILYDKAYEVAFERICQTLRDSSVIESNHEVQVSDTYSLFNMSLVADRINPGASNINQVEDSLSNISVVYNKSSVENRAETAFSNKDNSPSATKFILFFSRLYNDRLQAYVFTYNPKRQPKQYFQSYQGFYRTYLLKFDESGNIENYLSSYLSK